VKEEQIAKPVENVAGILVEAASRLGEKDRRVSGEIGIGMVVETLVVAAETADSGETTAAGRDGTLAGEGSGIRAVVTAIEETSHPATEKAREPVATIETDTAEAIATGASAGVGTGMVAAGIGITTAMDGTATGIELAVMQTATQIARAVTDPTSPAETNAAMISQNEAHDGVHRRTSNHLSPLMFKLPLPPAYLELHQTKARCLRCLK